MKLIGAGLPRTATLSQKIALEMVGLGPCYHMVNVLDDLDQVPQWSQMFEGDGDWDEIFDGYQSTVDWPGTFFYKELLDAYPDAKVLLSVRDGDAWERSMRNTIWGALYGDNMMRDLSSARGRIDPGWRSYMELMSAMWEKSGLLAGAESASEGALATAMERYNDEVMRVVPQDRLLVWSPAEGWAPLCAFLEVPEPPAPFPHVNDAETFVARIVDASLDALTQWQAQTAASEKQASAVKS